MLNPEPLVPVAKYWEELPRLLSLVIPIPIFWILSIAARFTPISTHCVLSISE